MDSVSYLDIITKIILIDKLYSFKCISRAEACNQLEKISKQHYSEIKITRDEIEKEAERNRQSIINNANMMIDDFEDKLMRGY